MDVVSDVIDCIPLVGPVKNGIEAGIDFYEGNNEEGETKALQALVGGVLDVATLGLGGTVAKIGGKAVAKVATKVVAKEAGKAVGKVAIKEAGKAVGKEATKEAFKSTMKAVVQQGEEAIVSGGIFVAIAGTDSIINGQSITNEDGKGGNKTQKQTNSSSKNDTTEKNKQEKGKKDDEPKKNPDKDDQKKDGNGNDGTSKNKPKRGDHVMNNAILSLYGDIIETFLSTQGFKYRDNYNNLPQEIHDAHDIPFPVEVRNNIGYQMVISGGVQGGTNHMTYGDYHLRVIRSTVRYMQLLMLRRTNRDDARLIEIKTQRQRVRDSVEAMIGNLAFVDNAALESLPPDQQKMYDEAVKATIKMLRELIQKAEVWVTDIYDAIDLPGHVTYTSGVDGKGIHYEDNSGKKIDIGNQRGLPPTGY